METYFSGKHKMFDVIVIGGGPAGLFTALNINKKKPVLLLEKNNRAGTKLLMSGSGQCNLTHSGDIADFFDHYGEGKRFLKPALLAFTNKDLIGFFETRGIHPVVDKNGKVFPHTKNAGDLLALLVDGCEKTNVHIQLNESVTGLEKSEGGYRVTTNQSQYNCCNLVLCTGGKSYPATGSTGDGYGWAASLGHHVVPPKPALTPVYVKHYTWSDISGVSLPMGLIYLYRDGKKVKEHRGDIAFTHKGLSGPGILDFSRYMKVDDQLRINLVDLKEDDFLGRFLESCETQGKISIKRFLKEFGLPESLLKIVLFQLNLDPQEKLAVINKKMRSQIVELFCGYPFEIENLGGFNQAMVTAGGVSLKEVSPKTMESRIHKGLFFAGEVLDVDGDTGGYNIQAAFSTAFLAAKAINSICEESS